MDERGILVELKGDSEAVRQAVVRGLAAAFPDPKDLEDEYSGHVRAVIYAVRAAVAPLM